MHREVVRVHKVYTVTQLLSPQTGHSRTSLTYSAINVMVHSQSLSMSSTVTRSTKTTQSFILHHTSGKPLHNRDIASLYFNPFPCMRICFTLRIHFSMLTYIYCNMHQQMFKLNYLLIMLIFKKIWFLEVFMVMVELIWFGSTSLQAV